MESEADLVNFADPFIFVADALNTGSHSSITSLLQHEFDGLGNILKKQNSS